MVAGPDIPAPAQAAMGDWDNDPEELSKKLARLDCHRIALLSSLAGLLALLPFFPTPLRTVLLIVFMLGGPGFLLLGSFPKIPRLLATVAAPAAGMSLLALIFSAELVVKQFRPVATTVFLCGIGICVALAMSGPQLLPRAAGHRPQRIHISRPWAISAAFSAAGLALFAWSMHLARAATFTSYGLLFRVPSILLALLLCLIALVIAIRGRSSVAAWIAALSVILTLRGYSFFATEQASAYYTYIHLGVIDWFVHSGQLAVDVDVYSSWPGAFALAGWFSQASGLPTLAMAHGFTLVYHCALMYAVFVLARTARLSRSIAITAGVLLELLNWIGQDYLSPQAFAFLLAVAFLALMFSMREDGYRLTAGVLMVLIYNGILWSHQLTPAWLLAVVVLGAAFKQSRLRLAALPLLASFAVMVFVNRASLIKNDPGVSINIADNSAGRVTTVGAAGQLFLSNVTHGVALVLWGTVLLVIASSIIKRKPHWIAAVTFAASGALLLTNYGGEVIFRVYLYSLVGAVVILAPFVHQVLTTQFRSSPVALVSGLYAVGMAVTVVALAQCTFGGWFPSLVTTSDVSVEKRLESAAGTTGQIAYVAPGFPSNMTWRYVPQTRSIKNVDALYGVQTLYEGTDAKSPRLVDALVSAVDSTNPGTPTYVVVGTPTMRMHATQFGFLAKGGFANLASHFRAAGWRSVYDKNGSMVFSNPAGARAWTAQK